MTKRISRVMSLLLIVATLFSVAGFPSGILQVHAAESQQVHSHNFTCYDNVDIICSSSHEHYLSCYRGQGNLVCGLQEGRIYDISSINSEVAGALLICNQDEHTHDANCSTQGMFESVDSNLFGDSGVFDSTFAANYDCGLQEHHHSNSCYEVIYHQWIESDDNIVDIPSNGEEVSVDNNPLFDNDNIFGSSIFAATDATISLGWPANSTMEGDVCVYKIDADEYLTAGPQVRINKIGTISAGEVSLRVPKYISSGRVAEDNAEFRVDMIPSGWSYTTTDSHYILTNSNKIIGGDAASFTLYYKFDVRKTMSNKVWTISCELLDTNRNIVDIKRVAGEIRTSTGISVEYHHEISLLGFDSKERHVSTYQPWLYTYFGVTSAEFDTSHYVYDVQTVGIKTTGMQPYTSELYFTPGKYPIPSLKNTSTGTFYRLYGYGAEPVSAIYYPWCKGLESSGITHEAKQIFKFSSLGESLNNENTAFYDHSIVSVSNFTDLGKIPTNASWTTWRWNVPITSDNFGSDYYQGYCISVLYRFKRDSSIVQKHDVFTPTSSISLDSAIRVKHTSVDTKVQVSGDLSSHLYSGIVDNVKYSGDIYSAHYVNGTSRVSKGSIINGNKMMFTADYFCLNPNRGNYVYSSGASSYQLDCIVDNFVLYINGTAYILGDNDYRITGVRAAVRDGDGNAIQNSDGTYSMFWNDLKQPPEFKRTDTIELFYSSTHDDTGDWVKYTGSEMCLDEVWWGAANSIKSPRINFDKDDVISRVMIRYPTSQFLTAVRIEYELELLPSAHVRQLLATSADSRDFLANWLAYHAYDSSGNLELQVERETVDTSLGTGNTGYIVRKWDDIHKYFKVSKFPYRNFFHTELVETTDYAGMSISTVLMDGSNNRVGENAFFRDVNFAYRTSVTEVSRIGLAIHGGLYNGTAVGGLYSNSLHKDTARANAELLHNKSDVLPYRFERQRLYVLLPIGFTLDVANTAWNIGNTSVGPGFFISYQKLVTNDPGHGSYSTRGYHSRQNLDAILDKVGDVVIPTSTAGRVDTGCSYKINNNIQVHIEDVAGRELVIIDFSVTDSNAGEYYSAIARSVDSKRANSILGIGGVASLTMSPKDGTVIPSGTYEIQCASEYFDADGNPYDLSSFGGEIYDDLNDAFPVSPLGDYLGKSKNGKTYTAISTYFQNTSGSGVSYSQVKVNDSFSADLAAGSEEYVYSLDYGVATGKSSDVVLFDSLEQKTTSGQQSQWNGQIKSIDLNGNDAVVYVNRSAIDLEQYHHEGANSNKLTEPNGWIRVTNLNNPSEYDGAKAIAVKFNGEFDSQDSSKSHATVFVHMIAPEKSNIEGTEKATTYNEIAFYDKHSGGLSGFTICNIVQVTIPVEESAYWTGSLPATGGTGTGIYAVIGLTLIAIGGALWINRRKFYC